MTGNRVRIEIDARDETRAAFASVRRNLQGTITQANLVSRGLEGVFRGVTDGIRAAGSFVATQVRESLDFEQSTLMATSDIMRLMSENFAGATTYIDQLNTKLGLVARDLPGVTADFQKVAIALQPNLLPAFTDAAGRVDKEGLMARTLSTSENVQLRAGIVGTTTEQTNLAVDGALGSKTLAELGRLAFFERNVAVYQMMGTEALKRYGTKWDNLTKRQKSDIFDASVAIDDIVKQQAKNSVGAIWRSYYENLFDATTGVLGTMRKFTFNGVSTTLLDELADTTRVIFGKNGLFDSFGKLLARFGVGSDDPLRTIAGGLRNVTMFVQRVNDWVKTVRVPDGLKFDGNWGALYTRVMAVLNERGMGTAVGKFIADGLNAGGQLAKDALSNRETWSFLGATLKGIIDNVNWEGAALTVAPWAVPALAGGILAGISAAGTAIGVGIASTVFVRASVSLLQGGVMALGATLAPFGTVLLLGAGVVAAVTAIGYATWKQWPTITANVSRMWSSMFVDLQNTVQAIVDASKGNFAGMRGVVSAVGRGVVDTAKIAVSPGGAALDWTNRLWSQVYTKPIPAGVDAKATGHIPTLLRQEMAMAPTGSVPLIANSSELILNRAQQRALMQPAASGMVNHFGDIIINGVNKTVPQMADEVIREIEVRLQRKQALGWA